MRNLRKIREILLEIERERVRKEKRKLIPSFQPNTPKKEPDLIPGSQSNPLKTVETPTPSVRIVAKTRARIRGKIYTLYELEHVQLINGIRKTESAFFLEEKKGIVDQRKIKRGEHDGTKGNKIFGVSKRD